MNFPASSVRSKSIRKSKKSASVNISRNLLPAKFFKLTPFQIGSGTFGCLKIFIPAFPDAFQHCLANWYISGAASTENW